MIKNEGRGSLLYIRKCMDFKQLNLFNEQEQFDESIYVDIKLSGTHRLLCMRLYRRGGSSDENNTNLLNNLQQISNLNHSHLSIMGDFNLTGIGWENCSSTNKNPNNINVQFAECTKDCYLYQHITEHNKGVLTIPVPWAWFFQMKKTWSPISK